MAPSGPTFSQIRAAAIAGAAIAICTTSFRLFLRARRRSLWWDDAWAFISMCSTIIFLVGMLIFTSDPESHSRAVKVATYYMVAQGFYGVIWGARLSILFTIVRLSYGHFRTFLKYMVGGFIVAWVVLFSQVWWTCERETQWKAYPRPACLLGNKVAIAQFITDGCCGLILLACPFYLFSALTHWNGLKIRLVAIFSSSIFTLAFSLAHAYAILNLSSLVEFMLGVIEVVVSLLVINLPVITGWFHKMTDKTGLTDDSGPSAHMNSFLKERLSVLPNISDVQRCTDAISLSSRRSTCIEITIVTDKQSDEGFPSFLQLPTVIEESTDDLGLEVLSDLEKTSP